MDGLPYECVECGAGFASKLGRCPTCDAWGSIVNNENFKKKKGKDNKADAGHNFISSKPVYINDIVKEKNNRLATGFEEMDRVCGSDGDEGDAVGLTVGSVSLIAGGPGIGKSTLLLSVSDFISKDKTVLYNSAEENMSQIKSRADRIKMKYGNFKVSHKKKLSEIIEDIDAEKPDLLIIDSIQTIYAEDITGRSGGVSQVTGCAERITDIAKSRGITVLMVGHATKDESIAGPNTLKHLVDTTLWFEGDSFSDFRLLRSIKNRYGKEGEIGVFEMNAKGLHEVKDASKVFVRDVKDSEGTAVTCILEGVRPLMIELQALSVKSSFTNPKRTANGISFNKLNLMVAVVAKYITRAVNDNDVYVNITGGFKINDPGSDLSLLLAIISSTMEQALESGMISIGEVGLTGDVHSVRNIDERLYEAEKIGIKKVMISSNQKITYKGKLELIRVENISEAVRKSGISDNKTTSKRRNI